MRQPARGQGYRINVDALLLCREIASLVKTGPFANAVDLGAGVGAIGLSLLHLGLCDRVTLVERDLMCATFSQENSLSFGDRVDIPSGDVLELFERPAGNVPLVVSNPPFFAPDAGPRSPTASRGDARTGHRADFLRVARHLVSPDGFALWIYPSSTLSELLTEAVAVGLFASSIRFVHPSPTLPARVAIVVLRPDSKQFQLQIRSPWFERTPEGHEDPELRAFLRQPPSAITPMAPSDQNAATTQANPSPDTEG